MDLVNVFRIARRVTESRPESAGKYSNGSLLPFIHYILYIYLAKNGSLLPLLPFIHYILYIYLAKNGSFLQLICPEMNHYFTF